LLGGRKKLDQYMPARGFNLGRWGVVCNLVGCFFVVESCVIYCFPAAMVGVYNHGEMPSSQR
jgi:hypothetical protein